MEERKGKKHLFFFWGCNGVYLHVLSPLFSFLLFILSFRATRAANIFLTKSMWGRTNM